MAGVEGPIPSSEKLKRLNLDESLQIPAWGQSRLPPAMDWKVSLE